MKMFIIHLIICFLSLQKVELINEETLAVLYFDPLPAEKVTVSVRGYRAFEVFDLKSSLVRVYSYSSQGMKKKII